MVQAYQNNPIIFIYTFISITILSLLLIFLNVLLNKILKKRTSLDNKKYSKRRETYELRVNSISTVNTVNTTQSLVLALLFLLFNIKMTLLVPMILSLQTSCISKQAIIIIYIIFIMLSVYIKITSNIIVFYKSKQTKYVL